MTTQSKYLVYDTKTLKILCTFNWFCRALHDVLMVKDSFKYVKVIENKELVQNLNNINGTEF